MEEEHNAPPAGCCGGKPAAEAPGAQAELTGIQTAQTGTD